MLNSFVSHIGFSSELTKNKNSEFAELSEITKL